LCGRGPLLCNHGPEAYHARSGTARAAAGR
jgi:hypothetical protein